MIDYDLNKIKILPADHIAFKDYDYAVGVEKKNKLLGNAILGIIAIGLTVLTYYIIKDADERNKKQN
jgi:hypothetical protein